MKTLVLSILAQAATSAAVASPTLCFTADHQFSFGKLTLTEGASGDVFGEYYVERHGPEVVKSAFRGTATEWGWLVENEEHDPDSAVEPIMIRRLRQGGVELFGMQLDPVDCN